MYKYVRGFSLERNWLGRIGQLKNTRIDELKWTGCSAVSCKSGEGGGEMEIISDRRRWVVADDVLTTCNEFNLILPPMFTLG